MDFGELVNIQLETVNEKECVGTIVVEPKHLNPFGSVHGGVLFSLADQISGTYVAQKGDVCPTVDANLHYLSPAVNTTVLKCVAKPLKVGKKVVVMQCDIYDQNERVLTTGIMTYMVTDHKFNLV